MGHLDIHNDENRPNGPMCLQQRATDSISHPPDLPAKQLHAKDLARPQFLQEKPYGDVENPRQTTSVRMDV